MIDEAYTNANALDVERLATLSEPSVVVSNLPEYSADDAGYSLIVSPDGASTEWGNPPAVEALKKKFVENGISKAYQTKHEYIGGSSNRISESSNWNSYYFDLSEVIAFPLIRTASTANTQAQVAFYNSSTPSVDAFLGRVNFSVANEASEIKYVQFPENAVLAIVFDKIGVINDAQITCIAYGDDNIPPSTPADAGKVLTVGATGDAEWQEPQSGAEHSYTISMNDIWHEDDTTGAMKSITYLAIGLPSDDVAMLMTKKITRVTMDIGGAERDLVADDLTDVYGSVSGWNSMKEIRIIVQKKPFDDDGDLAVVTILFDRNSKLYDRLSIDETQNATHIKIYWEA